MSRSFSHRPQYFGHATKVLCPPDSGGCLEVGVLNGHWWPEEVMVRIGGILRTINLGRYPYGCSMAD